MHASLKSSFFQKGFCLMMQMVTPAEVDSLDLKTRGSITEPVPSNRPAVICQVFLQRYTVDHAVVPSSFTGTPANPVSFKPFLR